MPLEDGVVLIKVCWSLWVFTFIFLVGYTPMHA